RHRRSEPDPFELDDPQPERVMTATVPYLPLEVAQVVVDESNEGFWQACREHSLTVQRCVDCGRFQHPPRPVCGACQSFDLEWAPVSGDGAVYSYTIVHHGLGALRDNVPFNIVVVELDESGTRFVSNLVDTPPTDVAIGERVSVWWDDASADVSVPRFRRTTQARST
ncbi:MAG: uncharacterized protein QOH79_2157, partial [Acidimicrobiaceae bacterium]